MASPVTAEPVGSRGAWVRWAGMVIVVVLAAVSAIWEAFLTPLAWQWSSGGQAHFVRLPVALVLAVVGNAGLAWLTHRVTGKVLAVLAPFAAWVVPMLVAAGRTSEGDLVLTSDNWVGLATMFAGALSFAVAAYWLVIRSIRRPA
ncbi:hypothetical protein Pfl04_41740 [Planosporangium flavigriseum]|uniref:Uncharacterized protein n=2 Tax=Planosporangium flavigriseum TaxID=373681 RepID=A0A8J3LS27_9ACTN|nr:hypothetical protein Pfl04_41740 [Planosporangium flavigriseum]